MSIWLVLGLAPLTLLKCELLITVQFGSLVVRVLLVTVCAVGLYCHIAMAELLRQTKSGSALVLKSPLAPTTGALDIADVVSSIRRTYSQIDDTERSIGILRDLILRAHAAEHDGIRTQPTID